MSAVFLDTPVGRLRISAAGGAIAGVAWRGSAPAGEEDAGEEDERDALIDEAAAQIGAYFAGRLKRFSLPLAPAGTPFRERARDAMAAIPYGETRSYAELAAAIGSVPRAVGGACAGNPVPLLVPCHRVTAAGGELGGWSGGPGAKRALLALEARYGAAPNPIPSPATSIQGGP